jgi:prepilin-type processing-associated H-X9-DG protein
LKQLGLAYHNHESGYGGFPPSAVQPDPANFAGTFMFAQQSRGWGVPILPFIEQDNLFRQYNLQTFFYNSSAGVLNQQVSNTPIKTMQCPSAPQNPRLYTAFSSFAGFTGLPSTWTASAADYGPVGNVSTGFQSAAGISPTNPTAYVGALQLNRNTPMAAYTDGTSNTILLAEFAARPQIYRNGRIASSNLPGGKLSNDLGTPSDPWRDVWGGGWADASAGNFTLIGSDTTGLIPGGNCAINCSNEYGFYSFHTGAMNAVFVDGSVRSVRSTSSPFQIVAAISRNGGEVSSLD